MTATPDTVAGFIAVPTVLVFSGATAAPGVVVGIAIVPAPTITGAVTRFIRPQWGVDSIDEEWPVWAGAVVP